MAEIKRTFERGIINKDLDERLIPSGIFKHAENVITDTVDGSDLGVVKNLLSNKKITNVDLGTNPIVQNGFEDLTRNKLYYFVLSDSGSFLVEYDDTYQTASLVLHDTRSIENRVLNLKKEKRITSVRKIYNDEPNKDLLIFTNNDMEVCCINIQRAKNYGENGFDKEDVFLIKKPPVKSPEVEFLLTENGNNEIQDKFILFAYRYKFLDGEYSALSPLSTYKFAPKRFELDYDVLENKSMLNNYNALNIKYNTGDKRVTDIQIVAKFSNSNNLYIVETINKKLESIDDNSVRNLIYTNKKLYSLLPEKEIFRLYDNVPKKAKALSLIGNRIILGNYTEGYNIVDEFNNPIKIDFIPSVESTEMINDFIIPKQINNSAPFRISIVRNSIELNDNDFISKGSKLEFEVSISSADDSNLVVFENSYSFILNEDFDSVFSILISSFFYDLIEIINEDIVTMFTDESLNNAIEITSYPLLSLAMINLEILTINISFLEYRLNNITYQKNYNHNIGSVLKLNKIGNPTSLKSLKNYEIGLVYQDEFKRSSTVLTIPSNTIFIPISNSVNQNKIILDVNNKPPYWAKNYRVAVKSKPLDYETIYVNKFYNEDGFTWAKLEGDNKDKVKENDILLVKRTSSGPMLSEVKIKVLELVTKEKNFIPGNTDENGVEIIEEAGMYMKIKPSGFSMGLGDYKVYQDNRQDKVKGSGNFPSVYIDLFSTENEQNDVSHLAIPTGSIIELFIKSSNKPESGWKDNIFSKTFNLTNSYASLGDWFAQNITDINLWGNSGNQIDNYLGKINLLTGILSYSAFGIPIFIPNPNGKQYLRITGTKSGMSGGRYGYLEVRLNVRTSEGFFVFETEPKKDVALDVYYLSEEVFDIENGLHCGNILNQTENNPAKLKLDFYNCFSFGNGIESYKIRDGFNENSLNIDYSPCSTSVEGFKEVVRNSDVTWSSVYNESSNINGLNEFNAANLNWKELDKQNGAIQLLHSREGNLLIIQDDKWGQVLFGKDALYTADGEGQILSSSSVLGGYIPYAGEFGITDIESFKTEGNRCYAVDKKRGTVLRLSIDGLSPINVGLKHWFRKNFQDRNRASVIGGLDPFNRTYQICIDKQSDVIPFVNCGEIFVKNNFGIPFEYDFYLNDIMNDITFNYNVTNGQVNISVVIWGEQNFDNLTGQGTITIPRFGIYNKLKVVVTPVTPDASIEITNNCPIGNPLKIITIVRNSLLDSGKLISKSIVKNNINYRDDIVLVASDYSLNQEQIGIEGVGKFPNNGDTVNLMVFNDSLVTRNFNPTNGNKVKYLISDIENISDNINSIIQNSSEINLSESGENYSGSFVFNRDSNNKNLFLIYDYRNSAPDFQNTTVTLNYNSQLFYTYDMIISDYPIESLVAITLPTKCNLTISMQQFILSYFGDSPQNDTDQFVLGVYSNGVLHQHTVLININLLDE